MTEQPITTFVVRVEIRLGADNADEAVEVVQRAAERLRVDLETAGVVRTEPSTVTAEVVGVTIAHDEDDAAEGVIAVPAGSTLVSGQGRLRSILDGPDDLAEALGPRGPWPVRRPSAAGGWPMTVTPNEQAPAMSDDDELRLWRVTIAVRRDVIARTPANAIELLELELRGGNPDKVIGVIDTRATLIDESGQDSAAPGAGLFTPFVAGTPYRIDGAINADVPPVNRGGM